MKFEFSAGGVVFKKAKDQRLKTKDKIFILLAQHSQHHGWVFPKGLIGDHVEGENKEDTAIREVKEETGIDGKIVRELSPITYFYYFNKEKIEKTVYYYIMEFMGGNMQERDNEMENVEWVEFNKVEDRLTYDSDKKVFEEASPIIEKLLEVTS